MLTNLDFLKPGAKWPPESEQERLDLYRDNKKLFEHDHADVYRRQLKRISRVIGNFNDVVSFATILGYQRLMTVKICDLLFGEPPGMTIADNDDGSDTRQQKIDQILIDTDLYAYANMAAMDVSRYGDGIMYVYLDTNNVPKIGTTTPAVWFPVVDPVNIQRVKYQVLAQRYCLDGRLKQYRLDVQIYDTERIDGKVEHHLYTLIGSPDSSFKIGEEVTDGEPFRDIGVSECPIFRIPNLLTSDNVYGLDDYAPLDSVLSELIVRVSQISKVLDVHANPSMSGPQSALRQDPNTGEWRLMIGDYYPRNDTNDPAPEYIVWDASFEANFRQIELLVNHLYALSEMGSALIGDTSQTIGQAVSGTALRRMMTSPLAKVRRVKNRFDPVIKRLVSICAKKYGIEIEPEELTLTWKDGLPDDPVEEANIMAVRTGGKQTISQFSAIKSLNQASNDDAQSELDQIQDEIAASEPVTLGTIEEPHDDI